MVEGRKRPKVLTEEGLKYIGKRIYERVKQKKEILYLLAKKTDIDIDNGSCNVAIESTSRYSDETVIEFTGPNGEEFGEAYYRGNKGEYQIFRFTPGRDLADLIRYGEPISAVLKDQKYIVIMDGHHSMLKSNAQSRNAKAQYRIPTHKKRNNVVRQIKKDVPKELLRA